VGEAEGNGMRVNAGIMSHGVPTVGYACTEMDRPGKLNPEVALPVIKRNFEALKRGGVKDPMKLMEGLKRMSRSDSMTFPDGTVIKGSDVVTAAQKGRKVVILGDTNDATGMLDIAMDPDLLVHEATNAFLKGIDRDATAGEVHRDTAKHGHSTPQVAGGFARRVGAKRLALNHFSPRYKGDDDKASVRVSRRIEKLAIDASGLKEEDVIGAWDFLDIDIGH
jgi:ribonuclease Z